METRLFSTSAEMKIYLVIETHNLAQYIKSQTTYCLHNLKRFGGLK